MSAQKSLVIVIWVRQVRDAGICTRGSHVLRKILQELKSPFPSPLPKVLAVIACFRWAKVQKILTEQRTSDMF